MEPITATIMLLLAFGLGAKATGGAIAHAAAGIQGKPSPTVQKWEAREKARKSAGLPARPKPRGAFSTAWQNSVEEWVKKAEQRHAGRMKALHDLGPATAGKAEKRLLRRYEFRARLAEASSRWFGIGRDRMRRISSDLREVIDERRAERAASTAETSVDEQPSRQQQAAEAVAEIDESKKAADDGNDAKIIPFPSKDPEAAASEEASAAAAAALPENSSTEHTERDPMSTQSTITATQQQTTTEAAVPEPTDLPSSINWAQIVGGHIELLGNKITDDAAICSNNAQHMHEQAAKIEGAAAALAELGFGEGGTVQSGLARALELAPGAAAKLAEMDELSRQIAEQLSEISGALTEVKTTLQGQSGLADEAQSQHATAGVAKDTRFYLEG